MAITIEELNRRAAAVRLGGKGSVRRTVKVVHRGAPAEDKKVQNSINKLGVSPLPDMEEVTMLRTDGSAYVFQKPKVQASLQSQCITVSGKYETKTQAEMLPKIIEDMSKAISVHQ